MKKLRLDYNKIIYLQEDTFKSLEALEELSLEYNFLTVISTKLFYQQKNLEKLNLQGNQIEKIEGTLLINRKLRVLDLSNNKMATLKTDADIELNVLDNLLGLKYLNLSRNLLESVNIPFSRWIWRITKLNKFR